VHRRRELAIEMDLLDREIAIAFTFPEDLARARVPDTQGLGGHSLAETASAREKQQYSSRPGRRPRHRSKLGRQP
jgi:hypothetical protein